MNTYKRHRFPPDVIFFAVWLYYRFDLRRVVTVTVMSKIYWPSEAIPAVAKRELIPESIHITKQYENNRAEQSHEATRVRERVMRKFKSIKQAQRFVTAHPAVSNLFIWVGTWSGAEHYRDLRVSAFNQRSRAVA